MQDELLIQRFREGDSVAFDMLAARYQAQLFRLALGRLNHYEDAEDAVQETLLRLARGLHAFRGESRFSTWLYRLALNTCMDFYRRRRRWHERVTLDPDTLVSLTTEGPELAGEESFYADLLDRALQELPPSQRRLILLRDQQAYSNAEAAKALGVSVVTLKARLHRARMALRRRLAAALGHTPARNLH